MAEDTTKQVNATPGAESRTLRIAVMGSSLALWILAPFMVISVNGMRAEMKSLRDAVEASTALLSNPKLESYQLADQDGQTVYSFKRVADPSAGMDCGAGGMGGCAMMKGAPTAASAGMPGCGMMKGTQAAAGGGMSCGMMKGTQAATGAGMPGCSMMKGTQAAAGYATPAAAAK